MPLGKSVRTRDALLGALGADDVFAVAHAGPGLSLSLCVFVYTRACARAHTHHASHTKAKLRVADRQTGAQKSAARRGPGQSSRSLIRPARSPSSSESLDFTALIEK